MHISKIRQLIALLALISVHSVSAEVHYTISLHNAHTQMMEIAVRVDGVTTDTVDFLLPVWRPGRYVVLDPAGTVREASALSGSGRELPVNKTDKTTWRVTTHGEPTVMLLYRVYANSLGDRTRHADDSHAFISASSVLMYIPDRRHEPVRVTLDAPEGWKVASGMNATSHERRTLLADNYDVLVDSPIEIGRHDHHVFDIDGKRHEIVIWPAGIPHDADRMVEDFTAIVRAQSAIFGDLPYEKYVYLIHAVPGARGGTEHLNSTIMQTGRSSIEDTLDNGPSYKRFLGLVSHEMFHTWNVKQLRPAGIHPYDYQKENYTTLLWVAEGTTSYYDDLTMVRAGLIKPKKYFDSLARNIGSMRDRPGARIQSVAASSFDAWVKFNHSTPDDINSEVSFYSKGLLVSFLLDLEIRRVSNNTASLDDVMRTLYERFPLSGPGFTPDDLLETINEVSGASFESFFADYVVGIVELPFEDAVQVVGLELVFEPNDSDEDEEDEEDDEKEGGDDDADEDDPGPPGEMPMKGYIGMDLSESGGRTTVRSVRSDGPAYTAGVIAGDEVVALNGRRLRAGDLNKQLELLQPTDTVTLTVLRRDELKTLTFQLHPRPDGSWKLRRIKDPTDAQEAAYRDWLKHGD